MTPATSSRDARPPVETAARRAYAHVKQRLLDGRFPGGTLLSENALAQELEISRTPVREAFGQLEAEGLVELYPRRGALVVPISPSEADDVREARMLIEPFCARRAAEAGSVPTTELDALIAEQERALIGAGGDFAAADRLFHRAIVAAGDNVLLTRAYDALADRHQRMAATTVARDPSRIERFIAEHREIAAALARGEGDAAADLLTAHLRSAHDVRRRGA
ncbi:MAG TPA: GntR family transcriptional regulator [Solirubrobacter sp.]